MSATKTSRPRLAIESLEARSLMAATFATASLLQTDSASRFQADVGIFGDWVLEQVDNDLTASIGSTSQGAQIYVDGSDYDDRVYITDMNATTGDVSLTLEQYTGGTQFSAGTLISSRSVRLHAGRALDPTAPVYISTKGGKDLVANYSTGKMTVYTGSGSDTVSGGSGGEYIDTGADNDVVYANGGNDTVTARGGDDTVYGGSGYDTLYGDDGNDLLNGGDDHDTLVGNAGNDVLYGNNGSDRLYGMTGNDIEYGDDYGQAVYDYLSGGEGEDVLDGGGGHDTMDGDWGDDTMYGGAGNDIMHGGDGDDLILGQLGLDKLFGDAGMDGLFGGTGDGKDTLDGGAGADRLLSTGTKGSGQNANREDSIVGATSEDARPAFVHGYATTVTIGSTPTSYTAKKWTEADVMRVDAVLALLHREGHGTGLLKRQGGGDMGIVRHGTTNRGFNDGWIHTTDQSLQFGGTDTDLRGYLLHEIGHSHDEGAFTSAGTNYWNQFKAISGWTTVNPNNANYSLSTNEGRGNRWYLTTSGFASGYAKTNEEEDFAESFAAYFSRQAGWTYYNNGAGAAGCPAKMAVFAQWAAGL